MPLGTAKKATMKIVVARRFEREFKRLPREVKTRLDDAIRSLAENPYLGKPLRGALAGLRSLRVGDYRVIYRVNEEERTVILLCVGHRRRIYRP